MAETLRQRLVRGYAYSIFVDGMRTFSGTNDSYHQEIKQYAAENFTVEQLDNALAKGWITQREYDDTVALRITDPEDPAIIQV
ncbi:hypothetical protein [Bacillus sp. B-jedd]|uniref:hypothetical protein n=1 Tax=Bacillus sp. B-jedd TaxID=1476857 RepID=UPI0005155AEA|nr:hypothetical protein [Bacillus sp. B-jedd]CEG26019.1 hypothetical protein BN1002_00857 [Bacillus sp. B-jedd]